MSDSSITDSVTNKLKGKKPNKPEEQQPKRQKKTYENPVRARRIRIFLDKDQETKIKAWLGAVRFCYNLLVASTRNVGQGGVNLASFRKIVKDAHDKHEWLKDIPGEIKDVAVRDIDKARKAHFAKLKKKKKTDPNARLDASFKFRSKKDTQESFEVRGRDMVRKSGAFADLHLTKLAGSEPIPSEVDTAVRFVRDRIGRFFLIVPREVEKKSEKQAPSSFENIVSLDPGVRTFQTTYDASGLATEWGKGDMSKIMVLCRKADKLQGAWKAKKGKSRRSTKHVWLRALDKIKNKVKEIHCKLAVWLCENYRVILIPKFESSKMVRRAKRKIHTTTARNMLTWSHYTFRERLKSKAELYPWVNVVECEEPYTSKTCGCCGEINAKLGGLKTFKCGKCGYVADRDINGARNILLRHLSLFCN
jgi:putative transposase